MYLTVCPLRHPGHDMTAQWEKECIPLSVLSMVLVLIAQRENECVSLSVLSMTRVQFRASLYHSENIESRIDDLKLNTVLLEFHFRWISFE